MYFEDKFDCWACGYDFDRENSVNECKKCHESFCDQCITKDGECISCVD